MTSTTPSNPTASTPASPATASATAGANVPVAGAPTAPQGLDRLLLDALNQPAACFDADGQILRLNAAARALCGHDPALLQQLARMEPGATRVFASTATAHDGPPLAWTARELRAGAVTVRVVTARPASAAAASAPPADVAADSRASLSRLSGRERQVLELLTRGYTNQQVADRLELSVKTAETYRARIGRKLNLRDRADFVRYGLETGLLTRGDPPSIPAVNGHA